MYQRGDILVDIEQDSKVIITTVTSTHADEFQVYEMPKGREKTVYDYNKSYDPSDDVYGAVYVDQVPSEDISDFKNDLTLKGRRLLAENSDAQEYYFPVSRLMLEKFRD